MILIYFLYYLLSKNKAKNSSDAPKLKAFIDVIMGNKIVTMDVLLRCENSLIVSNFICKFFIK